MQPNQLVSFDPRTERFTSVTPIAESGGGSVRHMVYDAASDAIWFGTDRDTIGRASTAPLDSRRQPVP
jgi:virginiamycin B lyase